MKDISANHAYKFRIYPTKEQIEIIDANFRLKNYIFNFFLGKQESITKEIELEYLNSIYGGGITYDYHNKNKFKTFILNDNPLEIDKETREELKKHVKKIKIEQKLYFDKFKSYKIFKEYVSENQENFDYIKYTNTTLIQETLSALDSAFKNMKKSNSRYPQYKSKYDNTKSYSGTFSFLNDVNKTFLLKYDEKNIRYNHLGNFKKCRAYVTIPSSKIKVHKLGDIETIITNEFFFENWNNPDKLMIKNFTLSQDSVGNYFISFGCCLFDKKILPQITPIEYEKSIGVDCNIGKIVTTDIKLNEIEFLDRGMSHKKVYDEINLLNKKLSNKNSDKNNRSNTYKNLRKKINKKHVKLTNKRKYDNHVVSKKLLENYNIVVFEDLKIKNMMKRTRNETEHTKQNTKKKRSMRRNIQNMGWYDLINKTEQKAKECGKHVTKVDPKYTSKTCSNCGYINKDMTIRDRIWNCPECLTTHDRDINAAINIKNKAFL